MSARRFRYDDWTPSTQTRIQTRISREPRDEQVRLPKSVKRNRPTPINIAPGEPSPLLETTPSSPRRSEEPCEPLREPEIVDVAGPNTWPRRGLPKHTSFSKRVASPSVISQCSARQSEISFGILDYYIRDPSPLQSPELLPPTPKLGVPRLETPIIDPAIEKFDFGLSPNTPSPQLKSGDFTENATDTRPGAEVDLTTSSSTRPPSRDQPLPEQKNTYRLFPVIKETAPPGLSRTDPQTPPSSTATTNITWVPLHAQPDQSYRPRKESLSSSVRSRKDSFNSFCGTRRIPMRIFSSSTTTTKTTSTSSSPPSQSRWSDDTITSPVAATTPGPRTSFASLIGRESVQYPACFFEDDDDDDEAAPLRRKFPWKRSASLNSYQQKRISRRAEQASFGGSVRRVLLCGCCS